MPSRSGPTAVRVVRRWTNHPVAFVEDVLGLDLDPWQADVLSALPEHENVAIRACHGVGKTLVLSCAILWFLLTRPLAKVPTTAPTFNKQVQQILWGELHRAWRLASERCPALTAQFELLATRLCHRRYPREWFAVGIPSQPALNIEGYHASHVLVVLDEAKGVAPATWEAIHGMRTTQEAKLLVASTPGGPAGEFFKVFTKHRQTWRSLFVIRPDVLRGSLPPVRADGRERVRYSQRVRREWVAERALEWGTDSPAYVARVVGDFPEDAGDLLIPYGWLTEAEDRADGAVGERWVACDVARYGRDRTVLLVGEGGTLLHGETIARTPGESTAVEAHASRIGPDARRPRYRAIDVTAEACQRLRRDYSCKGIIVDESGVGGGLVDLLKRWREPVMGLNFGASPTDRPRTPEDRAARARRHLGDSNFANLKAQLGMALRGAFERGQIALGHLPRPIVDALIAQASATRYEYDLNERLRLIDPDDQDELAAAAGVVEGRRSPDHFHALLLYWAYAGKVLFGAVPKGGPVMIDGIYRIGEPIRGAGVGGVMAQPVGFVGGQRVGGQAACVINHYGY